ncbi:aldehyde dehydrogenase family protein [Pseudomonas sp.]|uniref:aldehyde dehydrogenase family protein n=1 Tax=Pseudomonas sp. TaxID=306 RepID=UPI00260E1668|nr:aldehyde dehydrogenase family protein [Pseudomonas sp.]
MFSGDLAEAITAADRLEAGLIWVNNPLIYKEALTVDGWTLSGLGSDVGLCGLNAFRRSKTVFINHPAREWQC